MIFYFNKLQYTEKCVIIYKRFRKNVFAPVAQLDRVTGYEPVGQGFESLPARHDTTANAVVFFLSVNYKYDTFISHHLTIKMQFYT